MAFTLVTPIAVTIGGVAHSLVRVNQDNYGSEYLDRTTSALYDVRIKIRNTKLPKKAGFAQVERHNIDITKTVYGVAGAQDVVTQIYLVILNDSNVSSVGVKDLGLALAALLTSDNLTGLIGWQN